VPPVLQRTVSWLGRSGVTFIVFLLLTLLARELAWLTLPAYIGGFIAAIWFGIHLLRKAVWRLRNRLYVTYVFIAAVPVALIVALAWIGGYLLINQLAIFLVTSELDRRVESLDMAARTIVETAPEDRAVAVKRMTELFYKEHHPGLEILVREGGKRVRYPDEGSLPEPLNGWKEARGILLRNGEYYAWSHRMTANGDVTVTAPLTGQILTSLVPNLGVVYLVHSDKQGLRRVTKNPDMRMLAPPVNRFDVELIPSAEIAVHSWERPGEAETGPHQIAIHSRISSVLGAVFNRKNDPIQQFVEMALVSFAIFFAVLEIVSAIIGFSMTRTITGAVHRLYEGTERVMQGDFSHRIEVKGKDQLADLSQSFNRMTENLEKLLVVAKEKERLQSEVEIAREVQSQLYPRVVPQRRSLRLTAVCHPARMCSGDYYDYETIRDSQIAIAIGDVAGKGISAALLMATLQSSLRSQLQSALEIGAAADGEGHHSKVILSTSHLVSRLNTQLHAYTSPEKYATFCFGLYDEPTGVLTYTNAGHLPPLLVREGVAERLDVNGTVVGAFPFARFDESSIQLQSSDLLVCFTDGITEPENEYGEMFGEDRLIELIARNAHLDDGRIVEVVLESVREWTATEELQDDMTILLARRV
jgi:sigma-B regulation protein RsbU (phosphoserine phosphatase)